MKGWAYNLVSNMFKTLASNISTGKNIVSEISSMTVGIIFSLVMKTDKYV